MDNQQKLDLIATTTEVVKELLANESSGHDWFHIQRVRNVALYIATAEEANLFLVEMIALLHDVADHKLYDTVEEGEAVLIRFLDEKVHDKALIQFIKSSIDGISFKGLNTIQNELSLEAKIVQDADRLDAIGAIGIARTFAYGGKKNRLIYDPTEKAVEHTSFEDYKNSESCTINHFYEKLLHLKDRLKTKTGSKLAQERHEYMEGFLRQFYREWDFTHPN